MSRPARVALVVNDLRGYGAQRVVVVLAGALAAAEHEVVLVTLEVPAPPEHALPAGVRRVEVRRRGRGAVSYLLTAAALRRALRALGPDLVISHMTYANLVTLLAGARGAPVVVTEHNVLSRNLDVERSPRALAALVRRLYPRASAVVGVSDDVVEDLVVHHGVPRRLTRRLHNPLPREGAVEVGPAPHAWLAEDVPWRRLVLVGGLRRAKGHQVALDALQLLRARADAPDVRLVCVGEGPLRGSLEAAVAAADLGERVALVGHVADPRAWMAAADAVLVPSLWEGFGLVAVEAASVGTPVVASDAVGLREVVPTYARGVRVPAGSPVALADAVQHLGTPDGPGALVGPERPLSDLSPDAVARRYLALVPGAADGAGRTVLSTATADTTNPWLSMWVAAAASGGTATRPLGGRALLAGGRARPAGVHLQWPEHAVNGPSTSRAVRRSARLVGLLVLARARRLPVLLTAHNTASHHQRRPRLESLLWRAVTGLTTDVHVFTAAAQTQVEADLPALARRRWHVVPHGDYAPVLGDVPERARARARLGLPADRRVVLTFGALKRYKGVEDVLTALDGGPGVDGAPLVVVAGAPGDADTETVLRALAAGRDDVRLVLRHLPQTELVDHLAACDLVVLPYRRVLSSGSALLALSCARPVLLPTSPSFEELAASVGPGWVSTYDGPLTAGAVRAALDSPRRPASAPTLEAHAWDGIGRSIRDLWSAIGRPQEPRTLDPSRQHPPRGGVGAS